MSDKDLKNEIADLKAQIKLLKRARKYGLVWEHKPEEIVLESNENVPTLKEVKNRKVSSKGATSNNLLIEGDNYHALAVLNYTHRQQFDLIYIDPPYNTDASAIDYKNGYKSSSWAAMMLPSSVKMPIWKKP